MSIIYFIKPKKTILELHIVRAPLDEHFEPSYTKFHPLIKKLYLKAAFWVTRYTPPSIKNDHKAPLRPSIGL